jgi:hypothetical protein
MQSNEDTVDRRVATQPPKRPIEHHPESIKWLLNRFTSRDWTVDAAQFEPTNNDQQILSLTISHTTGSFIQCTPVDSPNTTETPSDRTHQIRIRNTVTDTEEYVKSYNSDGRKAFSEISTINPFEHPYPDITEHTDFIPQEQIHSAADGVREKLTVANIEDIIPLVFAGVKRVEKSKKQTSLSHF